MHQPIDLSPIIPNPRKRRGILPPMSHLQAAFVARTKLCPVCLQTKPRTDFAPRRDGEGGRRWYCRKCRWKAPRWKAAWKSMRKGLRDSIGHVTAYDDLALVAAVTRRAVDYFGSIDRLLDAMHSCLTSGNLTDRETMRVMMGFAVMMHQAEIAGKILNGTGEAFVPKAPPKRRGKPRPSRSKEAMAARRAERRAMNMGLPLPAGTGAGANTAAQGAGLEQLIAELAAGPDCDYVDPADLAAPDRSGVGTFNPAEDFSPFYLETARRGRATGFPLGPERSSRPTPRPPPRTQCGRVQG